jgi:Secretion system C-terminal sorting domain
MRKYYPNSYNLLAGTAVMMLLWLPYYMQGQATVRVTVNSGNCSTTCTDGFIGGAPDPQWRVNIEGQGWTTYPGAGICFTNPPNLQYVSSPYNCSLPATVNVCFRAFEDDGTACVVGESCLTQTCGNFAVPPAGSSATYTLSIGAGASTGSVNFTVQTIGSLFPTPTNNDICNAQALTLGTTTNGNNTCATVQASEVDPSSGSISPSNTVWYSFVAPASGHVIVSTNYGGTSFDTEIAVYGASTSPCPGTVWGNLTEVGSNDDITLLFNLQSEVELECLTPGQTYYVQVDGNSASDFGAFQINVSSVGPPIATNNPICSAIALTLGTTYNGNNECASVQPGEGNGGCLDGNNTVWHTFVAPASGHVIITTDLGTTNFDTEIAAFSASGSPCPASNFGVLSALGCNDDITLLINSRSQLDLQCLVPGQTYYVALDGDGGDHGNYSINASATGPTLPTNNNLCNAIPLTLGTTYTGNNECATVQPGEVDAASGIISPSNTVWHTFVAPASGHVIVTTDFAGTQFDTEIAIYRASTSPCPANTWSNLVEVGSSDDKILLFNLNSEADINCLTPGTTYYIQVDGNSASDHGQYQIRVTSTGPVQANNDLICNAINLGTVGLAGTFTNNNQNNLCATISVGEPNFPGCLSGIDATVWCRFTTGPSLGYEMTITANNDPLGLGDQIDLQLGLYTTSNGLCTGTLTAVDCDYTPGFFAEDLIVKCLQPNTTYWVQIDGSALNTRGFLGLTVTDDGRARATNDLRCNATNLGTIPNLSQVSLLNQNNYCGGVEPGEPVPLSFGLDQTVWYRFKPPVSGSVEIQLIDNGTDNIDLQVAVWHSDNNLCTGFFSEEDSYDDPLSFSIDGPQSLRLKCLDTSATYFIQVDGAYLPLLDNHVGDFQIIVRDYNVTAATNDSICNPIYLGNPGSGPVTYYYHNFCADNILEPIPSCFGTNMTVWYTFTAPPSGRVNINLQSDPLNLGDYIDLQVAVFGLAGNVCTGAPTEQGCDYNDLLEFPPLSRNEQIDVSCLTPGRLYWIMVDGSDDPDDVDGFFRITVTQNPGPAPVTNDNICQATPLGTVPNSGSIVSPEQHNFCATTEPGEPTPAMSLIPFGIDQTVWYTFVAPASGNMVINAANDPFNRNDNIDLQLAVYQSTNNTCTGSFSEVNSDYDPGFFSEDLTLTCLQPGRTYFLQVDGALLPPPPLPTVLVEGYFNLTLSANPAFVPMPTNDNICNSVNLGVVPSGLATPTFNGSNYCATTETGEPNVDSCPISFQYTCDETVWFTFTTNNNPGAITVELFNLTGIIPAITVYQAAVFPNCTFGNLTFIADQTAVPFSNLSLQIPCLRANTTYFVQVDGVDFIGDKGAFSIRVTDNGVPQVLPPNDDICNATNLGLIPLGGASALTPGTNICATEQTGEPHVSGLLDRTDPLYDETVWYRFTTSGTPGTFNVLISGVTGGLQTDLHVYRADAPPSCAFVDITEYDNLVAALPNNSLNMTLDCLEPNTTYYIQLDGVDVIGDDGNFNIRVTDNGTPHLFPPNDDICNNISLGVVPSGGNSTNLAGHNFCATTEGGEPNVSGCSYLSDPFCDETVWYTFTTSATPGLTTVNVNNTVGINASINVYVAVPNGSCNYNNLTLIEDADDPFSNNVSVAIPCLRPNTVYFVQVDGVDVLGDEGTFNIVVNDNGPANSYPTNDAICSATNLGIVPFGGATALTPGNNFCANTEVGEPNVDACPVVSSLTCDETVWYRFTTSGSPGAITVAISNAVGINAVINVYSVSPAGSCNFSNLTLVASRDDLLSNNVSITIPCLPGNQQYLVQVDGVDVLGDNGTFSIRVSDNGTFVGAPANDNICNAVALGNPNNGSVGPVAGNNNCATQQFLEPNVTGDDETVWYTFIAPNSGAATVNITSVSGIDANFTLYQQTGPCGFSNTSIQQVGSNHDNLISFSVSHTEECLIPGATYYIQIDGGDIFGDYGNFTVTVSDPHAGFSGPANDPCNAAITVPIGTEPCQGSGLWNVYNYGNPTVSLNNPFVQACGGNCGDTWYSFVMPASGTVLLEGNDEYGFLGLNNSQLSVAAYTGPCNNLTPINCDQGGTFDDPIYYIQATPGTVVYIQVFDDGGDDFNEPFGLCLTDRCGADQCNQAQPMTTGIWYCWDTDGATGESMPQPGYFECGDGTDPGHSVYFSYVNACSSFTLSVRGTIGGSCILGEPTDGISVAIYVDNTPCDWNPQGLLDCAQTDACLGTTYFFTHTYTMPVGTRFMIQIDGFDFTGNNNGQIRIDENCPLDIEYATFTGYREAAVHELRWTVTDENAITGNFIVERSLTGDRFEPIGNVAGTDYLQDGGSSGGSNTTFIDYGFTDVNPVPGHNYYRLRFIDQNGVETSSDVIDLYFENEAGAQIMGLYPNPARDWVMLETFIPIAGLYEISLVDLYGKTVMTGDYQLNVGVNEQRFDLDKISSGMYIVKLRPKNGKSSDHRKFIKQ